MKLGSARVPDRVSWAECKIGQGQRGGGGERESILTTGLTQRKTKVHCLLLFFSLSCPASSPVITTELKQVEYKPSLRRPRFSKTIITSRNRDLGGPPSQADSFTVRHCLL